jgi:hypothetical protein
MKLKHGRVEGTSYSKGRGADTSVQRHLDEHTQDGWTLVDHSLAITVEPMSNNTKVAYSFIWCKND